MKETGERILPFHIKSKEEFLSYLRHVFAYEYAEEKIPHNSKILEVGFGDGYGTEMLNNSSKIKKIIGIDIDSETVAHAKSHHKKCDFREYDGVKIPFKDNTFDAVVSFQVIEHVKDVQNYLKEIKRVLKKGGRVFITTPNRNYRLGKNEKPWNPFHLREYDKNSLEKDILKVFSKVHIKGIHGTKEIDSVEKKRVENIRKTVDLSKKDKLGLRKLLPEFVKRMIVQVIRGKKATSFDKSSFSTDDFLVENDSEKGLDLLVIAIK